MDSAVSRKAFTPCSAARMSPATSVFRNCASSIRPCCTGYRSRDWEGALEAIDLSQEAEHNFGLTGLFNLYRARIQAFPTHHPACPLERCLCRRDEMA